MKIVILTILLIFGMSATAQVEVKQSQVWRSVLRSQSIKEVIIGKDTAFLFLYQNLKYSHIVRVESLRFASVSELSSLLHLCSQTIEDNKEINIELGNESLSLKRRFNSVKITTSKGWLVIDQRNINKIKEALNAY